MCRSSFDRRVLDPSVHTGDGVYVRREKPIAVLSGVLPILVAKTHGRLLCCTSLAHRYRLFHWEWVILWVFLHAVTHAETPASRTRHTVFPSYALVTQGTFPLAWPCASTITRMLLGDMLPSIYLPFVCGTGDARSTDQGDGNSISSRV
jgi:hypothetical protein